MNLTIDSGIKMPMTEETKFLRILSKTLEKREDGIHLDIIPDDLYLSVFGHIVQNKVHYDAAKMLIKIPVSLNEFRNSDKHLEYLNYFLDSEAIQQSEVELIVSSEYGEDLNVEIYSLIDGAMQKEFRLDITRKSTCPFKNKKFSLGSYNKIDYLPFNLEVGNFIALAIPLNLKPIISGRNFINNERNLTMISIYNLLHKISPVDSSYMDECFGAKVNPIVDFYAASGIKESPLRKVSQVSDIYDTSGKSMVAPSGYYNDISFSYLDGFQNIVEIQNGDKKEFIVLDSSILYRMLPKTSFGTNNIELKIPAYGQSRGNFRTFLYNKILKDLDYNDMYLEVAREFSENLDMIVEEYKKQWNAIKTRCSNLDRYSLADLLHKFIIKYVPMTITNFIPSGIEEEFNHLFNTSTTTFFGTESLSSIAESIHKQTGSVRYKSYGDATFKKFAKGRDTNLPKHLCDLYSTRLYGGNIRLKNVVIIIDSEAKTTWVPIVNSFIKTAHGPSWPANFTTIQASNKLELMKIKRIFKDRPNTFLFSSFKDKYIIEKKKKTYDPNYQYKLFTPSSERTYSSEGMSNIILKDNVFALHTSVTDLTFDDTLFINMNITNNEIVYGGRATRINNIILREVYQLSKILMKVFGKRIELISGVHSKGLIKRGATLNFLEDFVRTDEFEEEIKESIGEFMFTDSTIYSGLDRCCDLLLPLATTEKYKIDTGVLFKILSLLPKAIINPLAELIRLDPNILGKNSYERSKIFANEYHIADYFRGFLIPSHLIQDNIKNNLDYLANEILTLQAYRNIVHNIIASDLGDYLRDRSMIITGLDIKSFGEQAKQLRGSYRDFHFSGGDFSVVRGNPRMRGIIIKPPILEDELKLKIEKNKKEVSMLDYLFIKKIELWHQIFQEVEMNET